MPTLVALFACSARQWSRQHRWTSASLRSNTFRLSYHRGLNVADELVVLFAIEEEAIATCAKIEKSAPRSDNLNKIERLTPKPVNFLGFKFSRWRNLGLEEPRLIGRQRWEMSRPQCPFDGWSTPNSWLVRRPSIAMIRKKHWPNFLRRPRS
jgi:hypothetical protein